MSLNALIYILPIAAIFGLGLAAGWLLLTYFTGRYEPGRGRRTGTRRNPWRGRRRRQRRKHVA